MSSNAVVNTLIIGYGNPMRQDDGLGWAAAAALQKENLPGVSVMTCQQLQIELLEEAIKYDRLLFIDAAVGGNDVLLRKLEVHDGPALASSHHLSPELLGRLGRQLYQKEWEMYICQIRGEHFDVGDQLSFLGKLRLRSALEKITAWINGQVVYA